MRRISTDDDKFRAQWSPRKKCATHRHTDMRPMPTYVIDGRDFSTLEEFYDEFNRVLVPEPWGRNLDAFNAVLRGGFGTADGLPRELTARTYNYLKNANIRTIRELVVNTEAEMLKML